MDSQIKSSFIPEKMTATKNGGQTSSGTADVLMLISVVLLAVSLALSAGVFLYHQFLSSSLSGKTEQLAIAQASFEPELIEELLRLDSRLAAGQTIIAQHVAPSELFRLIGSVTLQSVTFEDLSYDMLGDTITIRLNGKARSVNGVALQSSVFGTSKAIINPIFSGLDIVNDGVLFHVEAQIDPNVLRYENVVERYTSTGTSIQEAPEVQQEVQTADEFGGFGGSETPATEELIQTPEN